MKRGDQALFSCTVNFPLPKEEITYSWKFAEGGVSRGGARAKGFGGELGFIEDGESGRRVEWGRGVADLRPDSGFVQGEGPGI